MVQSCEMCVSRITSRSQALRPDSALPSSLTGWRLLWRGNPLYRQLKSDWPIGWVLEDEQSLENGPSMLGSLLSWILRKCRSEGNHMLEHTGRWLEKGGIHGSRRTLPVEIHIFIVQKSGIERS